MKILSKGISNSYLITSVASAIALAVFALFPVNTIVSSHFSFFSVSDIAMPLIGNLGFGFIGFVVACRLAFKMIVFGSPLSALVYYIPGVCASTYWVTRNKLMGLVIPAVCMGAFLAHPIGLAAAPYTFYWLIPMVLYFVPRRSVFLDSLTSTFIAHSVGSVVWLYLHPMSSMVWLSLIPVVAVERLLFALVMTGIYCTVTAVKRYFFGQTTVLESILL